MTQSWGWTSSDSRSHRGAPLEAQIPLVGGLSHPHCRRLKFLRSLTPKCRHRPVVRCQCVSLYLRGELSLAGGLSAGTQAAHCPFGGEAAQRGHVSELVLNSKAQQPATASFLPSALPFPRCPCPWSAAQSGRTDSYDHAIPLLTVFVSFSSLREERVPCCGCPCLVPQPCPSAALSPRAPPDLALVSI